MSEAFLIMLWPLIACLVLPGILIYYGLPGPFTEGVEETVIAACRRLLAKAGAK